MKNSLFTVFASLRSRLCSALLLLVFLAVAGSAQGTGDSFFASNTAKPNTEDHTAAETALNQFLIGVMKQYPCVDTMSNSDVAALIGFERWKEVLGTEREGQTLDEKLKEIAGAMGAKYFANFTATTLPNGKTVISGKIFDSRTGKMIANRLEQSGDGKDKPQTADAVAKGLLQDISSVLKKEQCEPHWTGTISFTYKQEKADNRTLFDRGGGNVKDITSNITESTSTANIVEAVLQPMTLGFEEGTKKTMSRVVHKFEYRYEYIRKQTLSVTCRAPGQNMRWRQTNASDSEITDEKGEKTATMTVWINVYPSTGTFEISVDYPALTTKWQTENKNAPAGGCQNPEPSTTLLDGELSPYSGGFVEAGSSRIRGRIDPENPDVLSGSEITGDLDNGQTSIKWNLRLVNPKTKK
jgi:hypothetical protein